MRSEDRRLRVFCPTHKINFSVIATDTILCVAGVHGLAENFPRGDFWGYCCNCQTYWASSVGTGGTIEERCPVCEREVARRYLCNECNLVSFESNDKARWKQYSISESEGAQPCCPGCLSVPQTVLHQHNCENTAVSFITGRDLCPFCDAGTAAKNEPFQTHEASSPVLSLNAASSQSEVAASGNLARVRALSTRLNRSLNTRPHDAPPSDRATSVAATPATPADRRRAALIFGCILIIAIGAGLAFSIARLSRKRAETVSPTSTTETKNTSSPAENENPARAAQATEPDSPRPDSQNTNKAPNQSPVTRQDDSAPAILSLSGDVDGMNVSVDGHPIGTVSRNVPKQVRLVPGQHTVKAAKPGYIPWERSVSVVAGASERISIGLQPSGQSSAQPREEQRIAQQSQAGSPASQFENTAPRRGYGPASEEAKQPAALTLPPPRIEPPVKPPQPSPIPMSLSSSIDGKYVIVALVGRFGEPPGSAGTVDVGVNAPESGADLRSVRGNLPGRPCAISFSPADNVAEYSFRETPGPGNRWAKATVRVRPKDSKRPIRFVIQWELQ